MVLAVIQRIDCKKLFVFIGVSFVNCISIFIQCVEC